MGKKSGLSVAQRVEVVLLLLRKAEPVTVLARRYGISENTLHRWKEDFLKGGQAALGYGRGNGDPQAARVKELERELAGRDQVIGELTIANRILKKTSEGLL